MMKKPNQKKMKKTTMIIIILVALVFFLSVFLYSNLIDYLSVLEKKEIYARVIIGENFGFDINGSALIFGMINPGGSTATRELDILNNYSQNVRIKFYITGDIKNFMQISENNFVLYKDQSKKIKFIVSAPKNTDFGTYEGKVTMVVRSPIVN